MEDMLIKSAMYFFVLGLVVLVIHIFESPEARRDRKIQEANIEYDLAIRRTKELLVYPSVRLSPPVELPLRNLPRLTPPRT